MIVIPAALQAVEKTFRSLSDVPGVSLRGFEFGKVAEFFAIHFPDLPVLGADGEPRVIRWCCTATSKVCPGRFGRRPGQGDGSPAAAQSLSAGAPADQPRGFLISPRIGLHDQDRCHRGIGICRPPRPRGAIEDRCRCRRPRAHTAAGNCATERCRWTYFDLADASGDAFDRLHRPDTVIHLAWEDCRTTCRPGISKSSFRCSFVSCRG